MSVTKRLSALFHMFLPKDLSLSTRSPQTLNAAALVAAIQNLEMSGNPLGIESLMAGNGEAIQTPG